jgi:hypothetical protein
MIEVLLTEGTQHKAFRLQSHSHVTILHLLA